MSLSGVRDEGGRREGGGAEIRIVGREEKDGSLPPPNQPMIADA